MSNWLTAIENRDHQCTVAHCGLRKDFFLNVENVSLNSVLAQREVSNKDLRTLQLNKGTLIRSKWERLINGSETDNGGFL